MHVSENNLNMRVKNAYSAVNQQPETNDLQHRNWPNKFLPPKADTDNPDTQRPACIRQRPSCGANMSRNAQAEEIEQRNGDADRQTGV